VLLHFFFVLTERKISRPALGLLYLPGIVLYIFKLNNYLIIDKIEKTGSFWAVSYDYMSPLFYIYIVYILVYIAISIRLLLAWNAKSTNNKVKRQSRVILLSIVFSVSFALADLFIIPAFFVKKSVSITYFIPLIWQAGIMYAMLRYRFLFITPAHLNQEILSNIDEGIILFNWNREVVTVNEKTKSMFGKEDITINDIRESIIDYDSVAKKINQILETKTGNFNYRLGILDKNHSQVLIDAQLSVIRDRFDDPLGILVIAREVKGMRQLQKVYKLTRREIEIIQQLLSGQTNQEIAEALFISLNTAKRHISNIYIKMGIYNKVQLLNMVQNFELLPEK
jgi:DNA-binding CsgD family transcriptional regulator/PAS domain-containing protein